MSALIDIVITFIAAMVSAAFVHFGAHSEKPRPAAPPPAEQTRQAYEPARFETVSEEAVEPVAPVAEAPPAPPAPPMPINVKVDPINVDVRLDRERAMMEARVEAEQMAAEHRAAEQRIHDAEREEARIEAQSQRIKDREMRKWQSQKRVQVNAR